MPIISALRDSGRRIGPGLHESLFQDKMKKGWGEDSTYKVIVVQEQRPKFSLPDPPTHVKKTGAVVCVWYSRAGEEDRKTL